MAPHPHTASASLPVVLAIDLGTSGCKSAVIGGQAQVLSWAFAPVTTYTPEPDAAEQDPHEWWQALVTSARSALEQAQREHGVRSDAVQAVCCSCQGEVTLAVDRAGEPLGRALTYRDKRGQPYVRQQVGGGIQIAGGYNALKLQRWIRLTGGLPNLSGKDPVGHMLYIREALPHLYQRTYKLLSALDYLHWRLCGQMVSTYDASVPMWATDNRNPSAIDYDPALLRFIGIERDKLPDLVPSGTPLGTLTASATEALGLSPRTRVVAGAMDVAAAGIGSGAVDDYAAHLYIGTSSWIAAHVPFKKTDINAYMASVPCAVPGRYQMIALQSNAGGNLSFLKDRVLYHQDELLREAHAPDVYKVLDQIAARVPAGADGLIYQPWLAGESCPVEGGHLRAGLFNLSLQHSREHIIRAFYEGVALNTRWMLRPAERFMRQRIEQLTIIGGGGSSDVWCQVFADVLGLPVKQPHTPMQANALGAAFLGLAGLGELEFGQMHALVPARRVFTPNPHLQSLYHERYETFLELHRRLAPLYRRLNTTGAHA